MKTNIKNSFKLIIGVILIIIMVVLASYTPLMTILNPATGIPANARDLVIQNETYAIPGLEQKVTIIQDKNDVFHIYAENNHDMFLALGFIQAKYRLFEMELFQLMGMGRLSQMLGDSYNDYDKFQTMTGAPLTAEMDWKNIENNVTTNKTDALTAEALIAYSEGINDYINYSESHNLLPIQFKLLNYEPDYWSPVYSFAVQEIMTQSLEFSDDALLYSLMLYYIL